MLRNFRACILDEEVALLALRNIVHHDVTRLAALVNKCISGVSFCIIFAASAALQRCHVLVMPNNQPRLE